ncbi:MAG: hypothetical protein R2932_06540 [Caldilineaceae bacterium]
MLPSGVHRGQSQRRRNRSLLRPISAFGALIFLSAKRLRYHLGLSLLSLLGIVLAVALVSSATFFSNAVDTVIMRQELAEYSRITGRPPFSSRIYASSSRTVPLTIERVETLANNVSDTLSSEVGLPVRSLGMMADTGVLELHALPGDTRYESDRALDNVSVIYFKDVADHIDIEGDAFDSPASADDVDLWVHGTLAAELGLQVNERFELLTNQDVPIPVRIAGFWQPTAADDPIGSTIPMGLWSINCWSDVPTMWPKLSRGLISRCVPSPGTSCSMKAAQHRPVAAIMWMALNWPKL